MRIRDTFRDWRNEENVRRDILKLGLLAALVAGAGMVFLFVGFFNVAASTGHWKVTDWLLHTVMRQSVKFHSSGIEPPPLDDRGLVQAGAGHFEAGCAPCHGSPAEGRNPVVREMTPHPPDLARTVPSWKANNLFWIVKHGVKFTGMPAWPARHRELNHGHVRDPEIWAMVAFLQELPDMTAEEYERLALGPVAGQRDMEASARLRSLTEPIVPLVENCARCHGYDGRSRGSSVIPRLDLQNREYIVAALEAYDSGARPSGMMELQAHGLSSIEKLALATYFAEQPVGEPDPGSSFIDSDLVERGRRIATEGVPERKIPACVSCHGAEGEKRKPVFPFLEGQRREYLAWQLGLWEAEKRGGTPYAHLMEAAARNLSQDDIEALAAYYASRPPARR